MKPKVIIAVVALVALIAPVAKPESSLETASQKTKPAGAGEVDKLRRQVAELEKTVGTLSTQLAQSQARAETLERQLQEIRIRQKTIGESLTDQELQERLVEAVRNLYASQRERTRALERLRELHRQMKAALKTVELTDPSVRADMEVQMRLTEGFLDSLERQQKESTAAPDLNNVAVVNVSPELGLAVLNVGREQGVEVDMPFVVLRGSQVVGNVRIVEVRDNYSGAMILRFKKGEEIRPGDRARIDARK